MKPYQNKKHVPWMGILLLIAGPALAGIAVGGLTYLISSFFYLFFISAFFAGIAGAVVYAILLSISKVHHTLLTTLIGFVMGLCIAGTFYGIPYFILRHDYVESVQAEYQVDARLANESFDAILTEETGAPGYLGYMKLRAREGDEYTNYLIFNSLPAFEFSFTMKSTGAWLYWIIETLLFTLPVAYIGRLSGTQAFNKTTGEWYDSDQNQIGSVSLSDKEKLLRLLNENDLEGMRELIFPEEALGHPTLEIYEQHCKKQPEDRLLIVKETDNQKAPRIRRKTLGQWELSRQEFENFAEQVKGKFELLADLADAK